MQSLKFLPLLGALIAMGVAVAQPAPPAKVVGTAGKVQGLVTVSIGTSVGSVSQNDPVFEGSRFVTGSTGSLDLNFAEGCVVKLVPNQSMTVEPGKNCDDRKTAVAWLPGVTAVAATGGSTFSPLVGLGYVAGVALIDSTIRTPSGPGGNPPPGDGGGGVIPNPPPSGQ